MTTIRVTSLHTLAIGNHPRESDGTNCRPHVEVLGLFVEARSDLEAQYEESHSTALGWAARWGRKEMVQRLLEVVASTNGPDEPRPGDAASLRLP